MGLPYGSCALWPRGGVAAWGVAYSEVRRWLLRGGSHNAHKASRRASSIWRYALKVISSDL